MKVQLVLIPHKLYKSEKTVAAWVRWHGYKVLKVDITANYYRFCQLTPSKQKKYITNVLPKGIKLVMFI